MEGKKGLIGVLMVLMVIVWSSRSAVAEQYLVDGKPLNVSGYITQGTALSLSEKDHYDTERDFQSVLTNIFLEGDYSFKNNLKFYGSGMFTADWIYDLKSDSGSWNDKLFDKSRKQGLYMDTEYWQLMKEAHITWTPGDFQFRLGKQIIAWGQTDGFRLMNQINPVDSRRGFADVEFESTIIPTWLLKAEYYPKTYPGWIQDLGFEFVWNPNITFIPNQTIQPGNDRSGIWAPNARLDQASLPFPVPGGEMHIGSAEYDIDKPRSLSSRGFEYGFKIKSIVKDTNITLNYWYGLDKSPTVWSVPALARIDGAPWSPGTQAASDGEWIMHPYFQGRYDLFRFVGGTLSRDIPSLKSSILGGVAPTVRLEAFYLFGNTLANTATTNAGELDKLDELRWALGVDWKIRVPFINSASGIRIMPQFYHRKILNYPNGKDLIDHDNQALLDPDNYMTTLMIDTSYMNNKLTPSFFWMRDINRRADLFRYQLIYDYSNNWRYSAGAVIMGGSDHKNNGIMNNSFEFYDNKDYMFFKVSYRWG